MLHTSLRWPYFFFCSSFDDSTDDRALQLYFFTHRVTLLFVVQFSTELSYVQSCCERVICIFALFMAPGTRLPVSDTHTQKKQWNETKSERDIFNECEFLQIKLLFESMEFQSDFCEAAKFIMFSFFDVHIEIYLNRQGWIIFSIVSSVVVTPFYWDQPATWLTDK